MNQLYSAESAPNNSIVFQRSDITEASLEVINSLSAEHQADILGNYQDDFQYKIKMDAAVCYLAVRVSMAKSVIGNLQEFNQLALEPAPWFVDDYDIQVVAKHLIVASKQDEDDLLVTQATYTERLSALSRLFNINL